MSRNAFNQYYFKSSAFHSLRFVRSLVRLLVRGSMPHFFPYPHVHNLHVHLDDDEVFVVVIVIIQAMAYEPY